MLWSLFLGARRLKARRSRFSSSEDRLLQRITAEHFPGGYTILRADGGWFDPEKRKFVREESRQVTIAASSERVATRWAKAVGTAFEQKEVLIVGVGRQKRIRI